MAKDVGQEARKKIRVTEIEWSAAAVLHLAELRSIIAKSRPRAASKGAQPILYAVGLLEVIPHAGQPGRVPGTREFVIRNTPFCVVFRVVATTLEIVAVLHAALNTHHLPRAFP
jgi:plasmid stabilization system protein ParE